MSGARRWITRGEAETEALGGELAVELAPAGTLLLSGELGSGKTVLARGIAAALGIDGRQVLSPTFNLIREHRGAGGRLVHVDLYRLEPEEADALGLDELLAGPGIKVVEWAERLPFAPPPGALALRLRRLPAAPPAPAAAKAAMAATAAMAAAAAAAATAGTAAPAELVAPDEAAGEQQMREIVEVAVTDLTDLNLGEGAEYEDP